MNRIALPLLTLGLLLVSTTTWALTLELVMTPAYVRGHPERWSVKVAKKENGLIAFTIVRTLSAAGNLVVHLEVHHGGKLIAESYGKTKDNTFYFSVSAEDLAESTFDLSDNVRTTDNILEGSGEVYRFRLRDFAPADLVKAAIKP